MVTTEALTEALGIALKIIHSAAPHAFENGVKDPMGVMDAGETAVAQFVLYANGLLEQAQSGTALERGSGDE